MVCRFVRIGHSVDSHKQQQQSSVWIQSATRFLALVGNRDVRSGAVVVGVVVVGTLVAVHPTDDFAAKPDRTVCHGPPIQNLVVCPLIRLTCRRTQYRVHVHTTQPLCLASRETQAKPEKRLDDGESRGKKERLARPAWFVRVLCVRACVRPFGSACDQLKKEGATECAGEKGRDRLEGERPMRIRLCGGCA